jgi:hypothetical protein
MRRRDNRFTIVLTFSQESIHAIAPQDSEELPEGREIAPDFWKYECPDKAIRAQT